MVHYQKSGPPWIKETEMRVSSIKDDQIDINQLISCIWYDKNIWTKGAIRKRHEDPSYRVKPKENNEDLISDNNYR